MLKLLFLPGLTVAPLGRMVVVEPCTAGVGLMAVNKIIHFLNVTRYYNLAIDVFSKNQ